MTLTAITPSGSHMTDQEREDAISVAKRAGDMAYLDGDHESARRWYQRMAEHIAQRSDEVVERMEKEMGLR